MLPQARTKCIQQVEKITDSRPTKSKYHNAKNRSTLIRYQRLAEHCNSLFNVKKYRYDFVLQVVSEERGYSEIETDRIYQAYVNYGDFIELPKKQKLR